MKRTLTSKYKGSFLDDLKNGNDCGITWIRTDAIIRDVNGNVKFEQKNVEFPDFWSQTAINIVSSKYFCGGLHTDNREFSLRQIITRVVETLTKSGKKQGYFQTPKKTKSGKKVAVRDRDKPENIFKDELAYIFVHQYAFLNSPVWFNVGIYDKPLSGACYILELHDTVESIIRVSNQEVMIFKDGAGTGKNLSNLRARGERLSGGGETSGVLSFMRIYDVNANIIRAAGRTRRSAMLELLDVDHPEIMDYIKCKPHEEDKAHALLESGFGDPMELDNEAVRTVAFQNMNISVGAPDEFMKAVREDEIWSTKFRRPDLTPTNIKPPEYPAQTILTEISKATHRCGDPGMFFTDTINQWNTCANDFTIRSSNPCLAGDTVIYLEDDEYEIKSLRDKTVKIETPQGFKYADIIYSGKKPVFLLETEFGVNLKCTYDHGIMCSDGTYRKAVECVGKNICINPELSVAMKNGASEDDLCFHAEVTGFTFLGIEDVYDFRIIDPEAEPAGWANGIWVHNCGEFLWADSSACNLASLNLLKFKDADDIFNDELFGHVIRNVFLAQDILINMSHYPSEAIRRNSQEKYRPVGLGYGNLGGLLMAYGVPYDSESGRAIASVVTAYMTAKAYQVSAEIASELKPYGRYEANKDSHWKVMDMHNTAFQTINELSLPVEFNDTLQHASEILDSLITSKPPMRNAQVTLLAPCGTIGFAMDLDSTGIEPLMGTVTYKTISGGGMLEIVPRVTEMGLRTLEYLKEEEIQEILDYIGENGTIENAPYIKEDDLAIFDCAYNHAGSRVLPPEGHIRMLSAVQPFLSGGISKTVSLPNYATVDDIYDTYMLAWDMGLKNVSIYRDGSKNVQPLLTRIKKKQDEKAKVEGRFRKRMPKTRPSVTHKFRVGEQEAYLTIGLYDNGTPGEIFINCSRTGSTINGLLDTFATMVSISLQSGVPLEILVDKFKYHKFEPSGITDNPDIRFADSIVDYIFKYLERRFLMNGDSSQTKKFTINEALEHTAELIKDNKTKETTTPTKTKSTGDVCPVCGRIMRQTGTCKTCVCGNSGGCEG